MQGRGAVGHDNLGALDKAHKLLQWSFKTGGKGFCLLLQWDLLS